MNDPIQYIIEQMSIQNKELRREMRESFKELRQDLKEKDARTDQKIESHDKRLTILDRFKWHLSGGAIVFITGIELAFRLFGK